MPGTGTRGSLLEVIPGRARDDLDASRMGAKAGEELRVRGPSFGREQRGVATPRRLAQYDQAQCGKAGDRVLYAAADAQQPGRPLSRPALLPGARTRDPPLAGGLGATVGAPVAARR